nr:hypothetical protein CFP56_31540 [Quercus suber]
MQVPATEREWRSRQGDDMGTWHLTSDGLSLFDIRDLQSHRVTVRGFTSPIIPRRSCDLPGAQDSRRSTWSRSPRILRSHQEHDSVHLFSLGDAVQQYTTRYNKLNKVHAENVEFRPRCGVVTLTDIKAAFTEVMQLRHQRHVRTLKRFLDISYSAIGVPQIHNVCPRWRLIIPTNTKAVSRKLWNLFYTLMALQFHACPTLSPRTRAKDQRGVHFRLKMSELYQHARPPVAVLWYT